MRTSLQREGPQLPLHVDDVAPHKIPIAINSSSLQDVINEQQLETFLRFTT